VTPVVRPAFCPRRDIVLSLYAGQLDFGPRQPPSFSISVVSTGPADCSFDVGPAHLALVIKEGQVRVWSSADCVSGPGGLISALRRGVPTVLPVTWNRQTSAPGCTGPAAQVPAGLYTAYAADGWLSSTSLTFRLG
jgi:hypothetical protein